MEENRMVKKLQKEEIYLKGNKFFEKENKTYCDFCMVSPSPEFFTQALKEDNWIF
jgi:hypothetical protein